MAGSSGQASSFSRDHAPFPSASLLQKVLGEKGEEWGWLQPTMVGDGEVLMGGGSSFPLGVPVGEDQLCPG